MPRHIAIEEQLTALKGDYDQAFKDCNTAMRLDPNFPEAYNTRGIIYKLTGEIDQAIEDYNKAIELDPNFAYAYYNRGIVYHERDDFERAIKDLYQVNRTETRPCPSL